MTRIYTRLFQYCSPSALSLFFDFLNIIFHAEHTKPKKERKQTRYKNTIHLWEFLLELLEDERYIPLISWTRKEEREFKIKRQEDLARRWGRLKQRAAMNYDKLSRALRYYYQKGIIKKVNNRPFPSYLLLLSQNESSCETIHMKMSFTCTSIRMKSNLFSFEWFRTGTRFENEAKDNSEMAYPHIGEYVFKPSC